MIEDPTNAFDPNPESSPGPREPEISGSQDFLIEGVTCWRREHAGRAALLIDGEAYFDSVAAAIANARSQILMLGWDFHSRMRLRREASGDDLPDAFAQRLDALVARRESLDIRVLGWDFAMIYALEREALPLYHMGMRTRPRVHFHLDDRHPPGASHHQKIVVVDDGVAFVGGFDLTCCRWDTREHRAKDSRRSDPGFQDYAPFHDVALMVDGEAARALGELARERWHAATGERLPSPSATGDPWPSGCEADLREVEVGVARTRPGYEGREETREIEELYIRSIGLAKHCIYIENQYLTAARIGEILAQSLEQPDGPQIVIVAPHTCSGWLEESTMGLLRARMLDRLRKADRSERLRVYHPVAPDLGEQTINVHSKVMIVDDRLLLVGSANLSNRSMGLDTECDLAIEGESAGTREAIMRLRDDLLAEHLGTSVERVTQAIAEQGSLIGGIEALRGGPRTLEPIMASLPEWIEEVLPETVLFDPERPIDTDQWLDSFAPTEVSKRERPLIMKLGVSVLVLIALTVLWRWTPLHDWIEPESIASLAGWLRGDPAGVAIAIAAIVLGSCLMVPVTAMIVTTGLIFGWLVGFFTALTGALLGAMAGYAIGRYVWHDAFRRLGGRRINRISEVLAQRGLISVALVRLVPSAPFTVVNMVAGASHIGVRDFLAGTLLGMAPGALALTVFASSAKNAIRDPGWSTILSLVVFAGLLGLGFWRLSRYLEGRESEMIRDDDSKGA